MSIAETMPSINAKIFLFYVLSFNVIVFLVACVCLCVCCQLSESLFVRFTVCPRPLYALYIFCCRI